MTDTPLPAAARDHLDAGLAALGLDAALAEPLARYLALMLRWNAAYNLTAIREPREMVVKHLLDSLAMAPAVAALPTLADLGTGPGLPGIPLAIATPGLRVTLVEKRKNPDQTVFHSTAVGEPPFMLGISVWCAIKDAVASLADYRAQPQIDAPATPERVLWGVEQMRRLKQAASKSATTETTPA